MIWKQAVQNRIRYMASHVDFHCSADVLLLSSLQNVLGKPMLKYNYINYLDQGYKLKLYICDQDIDYISPRNCLVSVK